MDIKLNRRQLLVLLAGAGAAITLEASAKPKQVDAAWEQLVAAPWFWSVNESDTIVDEVEQDLEVNADVFDVSARGLKTPADVVSEVDNCEPLRSLFEALCADELEEIESQLDDEDELSAAEKRRLNKLKDAIDDDGWEGWVLAAGPKAVPGFVRHIERWLAQPIDWAQSEWFDTDASGQGRALSFFQALGRDVNKALGVVIIEGEHPGSTYYAAELRNEVEDANAVAERLKLPFRFRKV